MFNDKNKPIIVITHERSGTHMLINIINHDNLGKYYSVGYMDRSSKKTIENYLYHVEKDIYMGKYMNNTILKSHHQVNFFNNIIDDFLNDYKVIYLKRDIKDVLVSYYRFLNDKGNKQPLDNFPPFKEWIFMNPLHVGNDILGYNDFPDPHVIIQPRDYVHRWLIHVNGWSRYRDKILFLNYEDILTSFKTEKEKIEDYINKEVSNTIPDINDPLLPNISPNKGIIGVYKNMMDDETILKIDDIISSYELENK
jgi:hypothetical protein